MEVSSRKVTRTLFCAAPVLASFSLTLPPASGLLTLPPGSSSLGFTNLTERDGIKFVHFKGNNGISLNREEFGPGMCVGDFDREGW
jgi:hypothetical protein